MHIIPPFLDARILVGVAVVYLLPHTNVTTFNANGVCIPHILKLLESCRRVDVVWDSYIASSIKSQLERKGEKVCGERSAVQPRCPATGRLPPGFHKQGGAFPVPFRQSRLQDWPDGKEVFITSGTDVISRGSDHSMPRCDHEEADTRIVVHLKDALDKGCTTVWYALSTQTSLSYDRKVSSLTSQHQMAAIWVAFGNWKELHVPGYQCHMLCLGKDRSTALPMFHSFTGCDTTSAFFGKGKKSVWEAWNAYVEVTEASTTS
ncbi:hypothetical protein GWK47_032424 [Chionoecetes opilio]|uniref:Uncharacterized protein n=1 Tax=Chionoecetes opilio TaxID=41210 RepID=A0A8J5D0R0_CHIOP|nr:hypothetical protein GWK47_032424 [Chionoecetes opilio]